MDSKTTTKRRDSKTSKDMKTERKNSKDLKNMEKEEKKAEKIVKEDKEDEKKAKKQRKAMKKQFQEEIKAINESIMKEGENTFYTVLPQKIKKLDEFLKVRSPSSPHRSYPAVSIDKFNVPKERRRDRCLHHRRPEHHRYPGGRGRCQIEEIRQGVREHIRSLEEGQFVRSKSCPQRLSF